MSEYPSQAVRMEARSNVSVRTKQHFAPTAIQGLEVLSLPVARLDAYVRDLVERNPLLDFDYDHGSLSFEELPDEDGDASADVELIKRIQQHTALIQQLTHDMIEARKVANKIEDQREKALAYHDTVAVYFDQIRKHVDRLEEIVDDQMWPLPKYRELLFLR